MPRSVRMCSQCAGQKCIQYKSAYKLLLWALTSAADVCTTIQPAYSCSCKHVHGAVAPGESVSHDVRKLSILMHILQGCKRCAQMLCCSGAVLSTISISALPHVSPPENVAVRPNQYGAIFTHLQAPSEPSPQRILIADLLHAPIVKHDAMHPLRSSGYRCSGALQ